MEEQRKRIEYVDALKGFAIICVVLGHTIQGYMVANIFPDINLGLHNVHNVIYSFHMALFFAISGYVYSLVYFDGERNVKGKKIKSHIIDLVWLYLVFSVLLWAFKYVGGDGVNKAVSVTDLLMIWAIPIAPYWYLYVLVALYLIFIPLIRKWFDPRIIFTVLVILCLVSGFIGRAWFSINRILYFAIFFWIGIFNQRNGGFVLMRKWGAAISFFVALALMVVFWNSETNFNGIPIANAVIAVGIVSMCWFVFENLTKRGGRSVVTMREIFPRNLSDSRFYRCGIENIGYGYEGDGKYADSLPDLKFPVEPVPTNPLRLFAEETEPSLAAFQAV